MTLVIGIDPGGTTGLAAVEYTPERGYRLRAHLGAPLSAAELGVQLGYWIESFASLEGPWWIAVERFVVNRRAGRSGTAAAGERSRDILGAVGAAYPGRVKPASAAAAKGWATNERVRAAGLWPTQGRPHTTDAVRHALRFQVVHLGNPDPLGNAFELAELERGRG